MGSRIGAADRVEQPAPPFRHISMEAPNRGGDFGGDLAAAGAGRGRAPVGVVGCQPPQTWIASAVSTPKGSSAPFDAQARKSEYGEPDRGGGPRRAASSTISSHLD